MATKPALRLYAITEDVAAARKQLLSGTLADDDYTIRLWNAESKLLELGHIRGRDGIWRKRVTAEEMRQMMEIKKLGYTRPENE